MVPVGVIQHSRKGWQVVHQCDRCGHRAQNILLLEDPNMPDSLETVLELMRKGG